MISISVAFVIFIWLTKSSDSIHGTQFFNLDVPVPANLNFIDNSNSIDVQSFGKSSPICLEQLEQLLLHNEEKKIPNCAVNVGDLLKGLDIPELANFDGVDEVSLLPPWANTTLAIRGQQFAMEHFHSVILSHGYGLVMLLAFPQISDVLLHTDKSSTPKTAALRYASTIVQVILWMRRAFSTSSDFNWVLKSLANVRRIHQQVTLRIKSVNRTLNLQKRFGHTEVNSGMWEAFSKDLEISDIPSEFRVVPEKIHSHSGDILVDNPMNQFAFAVTQWAFIGIAIMKPESVLLFNATDEDIHAFAHLWAVIGHTLGIQDEFNIALKPDVRSLRIYMTEIYKKYYLPILFNLSHGSRILMEAMLHGLVEIMPILEPEMMLRGILRDFVGIPTPNLNSRRDIQGLKLDLSLVLGQLPTQINPLFDSTVSPFSSLMHFPIGLRYFGGLYKNDEFISKYCFYY